MRKILTIIAFLVSVNAAAQQLHTHHVGCDCGEISIQMQEEAETVTRNFVNLAPRFGVSWQKSFFAEAGLALDIYRIGYTEASEFVSFAYRNMRPYISGEIMIRGDKTIGGPKAGFEFIMSTNVFGMAVGADVSWYTDGTRDALAITPRLMLSFVYLEVYYGYNIFTHNNLKPWLGSHRVGVSMVLNPRFWRHKKSIYEDYYESY